MDIVSRNSISPNATAVLVKLARRNTSEALNSLRSISNQMIPAAANMCSRTARTNSTEGLNCLATIRTDYSPNPTPVPSDDIVVSSYDLAEIKRKAMRAKRALRRGNTKEHK